MLFASILVAPGGDTYDAATFGTQVAAAYSSNHNQSVGFSYANSISGVTEGGGCAAPQFGGSPYNGYSWLGGIDGCGCNAVISYANTAANATYLVQQTNWSGLQYSNTRASAATNYTYIIGCNYNAGGGNNPPVFGWTGGN